MKKIGARAFAETPTTELYFNGQPDDIAPDAFAGCKTDIYYINDTFGEAMRRDYGGTLTYHCLYRFNANYIYVGSEDEINGSGTSFLPEGELYDTDLSPYEEEWAFSHFEVTEGSLPEDIDPNDPHITFTPCGDVSLNVYYEAAGAQG